ncbi:hypothetical protein [Rhodococcus rhodochrous]|uniref:hypothetical protein n=1 Tax=Rhodococcus rhodochrous TaxID=1829 RepID=UPI00177EC054|nr:hypothetical protein [Rhodococcus rhodochrous]QOH55222.1 hypothetical protein C6Y44_03985 [Rhodococcus rhodochrous]
MTNTLSDTDMRAIADQLGPQYALLHCPPIALPWCSTDETAGLTLDEATGDVRITTTGPLDREARSELTHALVATILDDPVQENSR